MLDPQHVLVIAPTGGGKTVFVRRLCWNAPDVAARFVFDWNDRFTYDWTGAKLPLRSCYSYTDLNNALPSRWGIYDPKREFPGAAYDRKIGVAALKHFCRYVRAVSKGGPGQKLVCIAELWNFCNEDSIPAELAMLAQDGRSDNVRFVFDTQRPELLNPSIVGAAYEVVCFRHHESNALKAIGKMMGHDPRSVASQAKGEFVSRTLDGGRISGKLF
jgi:hypothetical protein